MDRKEAIILSQEMNALLKSADMSDTAKKMVSVYHTDGEFGDYTVFAGVSIPAHGTVNDVDALQYAADITAAAAFVKRVNAIVENHETLAVLA